MCNDAIAEIRAYHWSVAKNEACLLILPEEFTRTPYSLRLKIQSYEQGTDELSTESKIMKKPNAEKKKLLDLTTNEEAVTTSRWFPLLGTRTRIDCIELITDVVVKQTKEKEKQRRILASAVPTEKSDAKGHRR